MPIDITTYPKISVITPSFNQAEFIEQTIQSVIYQGYPNLEYIILDAASTDHTIDIIKKYQKHITYWHSKPDKGQAAAINTGFAMATGDILCWLNSDDYYLPGTLHKIAQYFIDNDNPKIVFGNCLQFNEDYPKSSSSDVVSHHNNLHLQLCDYIVQPSSFWNRDAWEATGLLNEEMHYAFDWEWFLRAQNAGVEFTPLKNILSMYRIHQAHKTGSGNPKREMELIAVYEKYNGEKVSSAYKKWNRLKTKYPTLPKVLHFSELANIVLIKKIIYYIFFSKKLSFEKFINIYRM